MPLFTSNLITMDASRFQYLTITASFLSLTLHYLQGYLFHIFSPTTYNIALAFSIYSQLAVIFSFIGVVGAVRRSISLTRLFSRFYLLDTFISAGIRFTILLCSFGLRQGICYDYVSNTSSAIRVQSSAHSLTSTNEGCVEVLNLVIGILGVGIVGSTCAQLFLAITVREFARGKSGFGVSMLDSFGDKTQLEMMDQTVEKV